MEDIKELRKKIHMLKLEQQWLRAKTKELKTYLISTNENLKSLREEIQRRKAENGA